MPLLELESFESPPGTAVVDDADGSPAWEPGAEFAGLAANVPVVVAPELTCEVCETFEVWEELPDVERAVDIEPPLELVPELEVDVPGPAAVTLSPSDLCI